MTERDYMIATTLTRLRIVVDCLRGGMSGIESVDEKLNEARRLAAVAALELEPLVSEEPAP